jgi:hypothetical protein
VGFKEYEMGGLVVTGISFFFVWFLRKVLGESPEDACKQDAWHRFKKKFRAGRIYHLFAIKTDELSSAKFLSHWVAGVLLLIAMDISLDVINRSYLPLNQMQKIEGTVIQFSPAPAKNNCQHQVIVRTHEGDKRYAACVDNDKYTRLYQVVGKRVTVWIGQQGTFLSGIHQSIHQIEHDGKVIVQYRIESEADFTSVQRNLWILISVLFTLAVAFFIHIAASNIKTYGYWQPRGESL